MEPKNKKDYKATLFTRSTEGPLRTLHVILLSGPSKGVGAEPEGELAVNMARVEADMGAKRVRGRVPR